MLAHSKTLARGRMRILYSHRVQSRDGQSVHIEELVAAFRAAGHEVLVVGPGFYAQAEFGAESRLVAVLRRLLPGALSEFAEIAYGLHAYRRLMRAARAFAPDLIYERYALYHLAGAWVARRTGLPLFLEVNAPLADERSRFGGIQAKRLAFALERHVWRAATRVLAVTFVLRDMIAAAGVPPSRIEVVPNGVVLARFPPPVLRYPPDPAVELGFVGFVRSWHGMDAVIDAMAAYQGPRPVRLTVIGDGPVRAELERQAARLGLAERVRFTGVVGHAEVPALIAKFDIALQPKVVAYASPLKVFDYMAAGRAIVAPDQPNIREILQHGRTALLFDPDAPGALWAAIRRLIEDAKLAERLGTAARAELEARDYTWRANAERIVALAAGP
jgi:glycosyltransferase involved in cell wall biosynthesis